MSHKNFIQKNSSLNASKIWGLIGNLLFYASVIVFLLDLLEIPERYSLYVVSLVFFIYIFIKGITSWIITLKNKANIHSRDIYFMFCLTLQNELKTTLSMLQPCILLWTFSLFFLSNIFIPLSIIMISLFIYGILIGSRPPEIILLGASSTDIRDLQEVTRIKYIIGARIISMLHPSPEHKLLAAGIDVETYRTLDKHWKSCLTKLIELSDVVVLDTRHLTEHVKAELVIFCSNELSEKKRIAIVEQNCDITFPKEIIVCQINNYHSALKKHLPEYSVQTVREKPIGSKHLYSFANIIANIKNCSFYCFKTLISLSPFLLLWSSIFFFVNHLKNDFLDNHWLWGPCMIFIIFAVLGDIYVKTRLELDKVSKST